MSDPNTRVIVVGKDCYAKYYSQCPFKVDAGWAKKEGYKYGWIEVMCCVDSGKSFKSSICPNGIGYETRLGEEHHFDPKMMWKPQPLSVPVTIEDVVEVKKPMESKKIKVTKLTKRAEKAAKDEQQRTF